MSVSRTSKCLFCTFARSFKPTAAARRKFHASPSTRDKPPKSKELEEIESFDINKRAKEFEYYDAKDLAKHYTPEQIAAIEAAQKVIKPDQLGKESTERSDPWAVDYYDDFLHIDPVVDKPVRNPWTNIDHNSRLKTEDEIAEDLTKLMRSVPPDGKVDRDFWEKFDTNLRLTVGREEAERYPRTALAPSFPKLTEKEPVKKGAKSSDTQGYEASPALVRLMQMTGYDQKQIMSLRVKSIVSHRVVNQTRLGKIGKMYFLSVAGNGRGLVGIGEGKAEEPQQARLQSQYRAIRNMQPILRYESRTIFGDVKGKVSATELELFARPPGFGLRCQQYIWEICKCAGITDLAARVTRARNPMNTVKATMQALLSQKDPEDIARARGKKLVDVRKVYYAGQV